MSAPHSVHPDLFEILEAATRTPREYCFATRAEATTLRHRLYTARRKLAHAGHALAPAFDTLSITVPRERVRSAPTRETLVQGQSEWYWCIGEGVIYTSLRFQIDEHVAAAGAPPTEPPPPLPQQTSAAGYVPPPRPSAQRESTGDILDDVMGKAQRATERKDG